MKKQLHIFMLTLLVLGQTILGPLGAGVASAESLPGASSNDAKQEVQEKSPDKAVSSMNSIEADGKKPENTEKPDKKEESTPSKKPVDEGTSAPPEGTDGKVEEKPAEDKPATTPDGEKDKPSTTDKKPSTGKDDADKPTAEKEGDKEVDKKEEGQSDEEVTDESKKPATGEDGTEEDATDDEVDGVDGEVLEEDGEEENDSMEVGSEIDLNSVTVLNFEQLVLSGSVNGTITDPAQAANFTPVLGDKVRVYYNFVTTPQEEAGVGSSFTFNLPQGLVNFNQGGLNGTLADGDVTFSYETQGSTVTVTITDGYLPAAAPYTGRLDFLAELSGANTDNQLEQTLEIPLKGSASIEIPFVFKPSGGNKPMTKTGEAVVDGNDRFIDWTVWTNRNGMLLSNAKITDVTDGKHVLEGNITIKKYEVGLSGVAANSYATETVNSFADISLTGRDAYEITYRTKVTHVQTEEIESFTNTATLTNNETTVESTTGSASHKYGLKMEKTATAKDKYKGSWQIEYNYFGSKGTKTLTDTVTGPHKIIGSTVKAYNVTVDSLGNGTKGSLVSPQPTFNLDADGKGFTVELASPNGEAYFIEYDTEYDKEFVTAGGSVKNTVTDDTNPASDTILIEENIFSKTRSSIDYNNKIITWTISVNAEHAMNGFTIEDDFESYSTGGTRQKLVNPSNPFIITNSVIPTNKALKGTDGDAGFTLEFGNLTKGQNFTITYQTKFDILPNGTTYGEYKNTAIGSWTGAVDGKTYSIPKSAEYAPGNSSPTGKNGYKNGEFDHVDQVFNWNLAVNINKQEINGATLTDTIGDGHAIVDGSIKVYKLNLGNDDETGTVGAEVTSGFTFTEKTAKKFVITFNASTTDAYIVKYQTKDTDNVIGNGPNGDTYGNTASFATPNSGSFPFTATAEVKHANKLIVKTATQNPNDETITWLVKVNESHSTLGNITLYDKMSPNQLILTETFEKREIRMNKAGTHSYGPWVAFTPTVDKANNSFTYNLGELNKIGYEVRYKTFFLGANNENFRNEASIDYAGTEANASKKDDVTNQNFVYNASSGTISSTRGTLELHKTGWNPLTGASVNLPGITFGLYNKNGNIKLAEAVTDSEGRLTFENIRYGKYTLKESGTPNDYVSLPVAGRPITMGADIDFNVNGNKLYNVVNEEKVDMTNACTAFTLTINDTNGDPRKDKVIQLINANGEVKAEVDTLATGKITVQQAQVPAGKYQVKIKDGEILESNLMISYEKDADDLCGAKIQPPITCDVYTIAVTKDGSPRVNTDVLLKQGNTVVVSKKTNADGEFTVPATTAPGTYKLYEGKQFLAEVEIDYNDENCKTTVVQVPKCETFTLTVRDVDGELDGNASIVIKDKDGTEVKTGTTDDDGQLVVSDLNPGEYDVFRSGATEPFADFTVTINCEADVKPVPVCTDFTIIVSDESDSLRKNVELTLKDGMKGTSIHTGKTNELGEFSVSVADLVQAKGAGEYFLFEGDLFITKVNVSFKDDCLAEVSAAPVCIDFTLTVLTRGGAIRPNLPNVTVKDAAGTEIASGTTDANGQLKIDQSKIKQGVYRAYYNNSLINSFEVKNECAASVKPKPLPPQPEVCEEFTIAVFEDTDPVGPNIEVVLKSGETTVASGKTNLDGNVIIPKNTLPDGEYDVYVNGKKIEGKKVKVTDTCTDTITLPTALTCEDFILTITQNGKPVATGKDVVLKSDDKEIAKGKTDQTGKVVFPNKVAHGEYDVYVDGEKIGTVSVADNCEGAIEFIPVCKEFTVTVTEEGKPVADKEVVLKKGDTEVAKSTTNKEGKVVFPGKLPEGEYDAYVDGKKVDTVKVTETCEDTIIIESTPVCKDFTVSVTENGKPVAGGKDVVLKKDGKEAASGKTDKDGKVVLPKVDLPNGEYEVFVDGKKAGDVTVTETCESTVDLVQAPVCKDFTVTVTESGKPVAGGKDVVLKKDGKEVASGKTDKDGKVVLPKVDLPNGEYEVFVDGKKAGTVTVTETCESTVDVTPAPVCEEFTITVMENGKPVQAGKQVILKFENREIVTGVTNAKGEVIFTREALPKGIYGAYVDGDFVETVVVSASCETTITTTPAPVCENVTITVMESGTPVVDKEVVLQANGKEVAKGKTDASGKVNLPKKDLPNGTYEAFVDGKEAGTVIVTDSCESTIVLTPAPVCKEFTVTVTEDGKRVGAGKTVALKSGNTEIVSGLTNDNGQAVLNNDQLLDGTYEVFVDNKYVGKVTVSATCEAMIDVVVAPVCEDFTLTVYENGVPVTVGKVITLKTGETEVVTGTTDFAGKIVFDKDQLPNGEYDAYYEGNNVGKVVVTDSCEESLTLPITQICQEFTITVNKYGQPVPAGELVELKIGATEIVKGLTNSQGQVIFPTEQLPQGTYQAYVGNIGVGVVIVDATCQAILNTELTSDGDNPTEPGTPGDPNEPGNPGTPGDPNEPGDPGTPGDPNEPGNPGTPGDPNEPGNPGTPGDPNEPGKPGTPGDPNEPGKPGTPGDPNEPGKPGTPGDPNEPGKPGTPGDPNEPGKPGTPGDPNEPGKPGTPGDPNEPGKPGTPGDPNEPGKPGTPGDPNEPGKPGTPGDPNEPGKPGTPGDPNEPGKPGTPGDPNEPGKPGTPGDPNEPGKPGTPGDPNEPGNLGTPGDPNEPGKPGTPGDPNEPGKPGTPGDPNEPGNPGTPGDPNEPGKPGTPNVPNKPGVSGNINTGTNTGNTNSNNSNMNSSGNSNSNVASTGNNLPQTGEAYPIIPIATGLLLIGAGAWVLRRKKHA
ncbi:LPXTG cell wall anchor domain-containing protein [Sporosarcina sp. PTS2304]|uniref:collagen binding domain-containing protein n=1 Tax=Sporosarcina sp. PTS2304 TaxID=2283194 RepID=UPI000E0CE39F|nr:collagen binding domain-containing protein [Sporosarcina sp. PTS2304]AXI00758.1 LPXTG cell wall anchor domain-containing protein [Sporosarcina sp. PTS2304]